MQTPRNQRDGFTLVEIMIVVLIFGIIMMIAIPGWIQARAKSSQTICQENLTKIDHAKEVWALENKKELGDQPDASELFGQTNYLRDTPRCPSGGNYTIRPIGTLPSCSLSSTDQHFIIN